MVEELSPGTIRPPIGDADFRPTRYELPVSAARSEVTALARTDLRIDEKIYMSTAANDDHAWRTRLCRLDRLGAAPITRFVWN